jgi:hypothetical protein
MVMRIIAVLIVPASSRSLCHRRHTRCMRK